MQPNTNDSPQFSCIFNSICIKLTLWEVNYFKCDEEEMFGFATYFTVSFPSLEKVL